MTRPYRVLIADDEKTVAVGLQNQLESLGYDVVAVVSDGQRAIEMCRRSLPDVVFMDIEMPWSAMGNGQSRWRAAWPKRRAFLAASPAVRRRLSPCVWGNGRSSQARRL